MNTQPPTFSEAIFTSFKVSLSCAYVIQYQFINKIIIHCKSDWLLTSSRVKRDNFFFLSHSFSYSVLLPVSCQLSFHSNLSQHRANGGKLSVPKCFVQVTVSQLKFSHPNQMDVFPAHHDLPCIRPSNHKCSVKT